MRSYVEDGIKYVEDHYEFDEDDLQAIRRSSYVIMARLFQEKFGAPL